MSQIDALRTYLINYLGTGMQTNPAMQIDLDLAISGSDDDVLELAEEYGLIERNEEKNEGRRF